MTANAETYGYVDSLMAAANFKPKARHRVIRQPEFDQIVDIAKEINEGASIFMRDDYGPASIRRCQDHIFDIDEKDLEIAKNAFSYLWTDEARVIENLDPNGIINAFNEAFAALHNKPTEMVDYLHIHGAITKIAIIHFVRHYREELAEALKDAA